ncbi:MAG: hypothetical protein M1826_002110 [Phylliscum demangeonii]|nr:MAG: hypothetical protein M1826_002110 [Phylliscum demangeonii]
MSSINEHSPLLARSDESAHYYSTADDGQTVPNDDPDESQEAATAEEPDNRQLAVILGSIYPGVFLAALGKCSRSLPVLVLRWIYDGADVTIIATLTGAISTSFRSLSLLSWLASAYLISNAAFQPLSGRLTDIFSRRTGLIASNIFFALGNLLCGLATSESMILTGRIVAGIGGGGLTAITTFVASDLVPLRKRGVVQGFGNVSFGLGSGLGGVFGGLVNDVWGWRTAFLVQVPLTILSVIAVCINVPGRDPTAEPASVKRIDFLGALSLVTALVLFLLGVNAGGNTVAWTHPLVLTSLPLSALGFLLFIYVEARLATEPIIPVRLLLHRTVASACLTNWFTTMAVFALLFYGPIYFQVQGLSTTQAGARLIPHSVGGAVGSLATGLLMKSTGRYWALNVGVEAIFVLATAIICTFTLQTAIGPALLDFFLAGLGYGGMLTITLLALISAVDHVHQAVVTSASYAFRATGATLGITLASSVFQNVLRTRLWDRFGDRPGAAERIARIRDSLDEIQRLPDSWQAGVRQSYMDALTGVFLTSLALAVVGAVISLFMREHTLHRTLARR